MFPRIEGFLLFFFFIEDQLFLKIKINRHKFPPPKAFCIFLIFIKTYYFFSFFVLQWIERFITLH